MPDAIVYFNGSFVPKQHVVISPDDRGYHFGDGVYEVVRLYDGRPFQAARHAARFERSLRGIDIPVGDLPDKLAARSIELANRNGLTNALIYWQVTRGTTPRKHAAPDAMEPTVFASASAASGITMETPLATGRLITHPDRRWADCWIKSLQLLPNTLAKTQAVRQGAAEAVLHREGTVTEGASTTVLIVSGATLATHPLDGSILPGCVRALLIAEAERLGIPVVERPFGVDELKRADEVFIAGTGTQLLAATQVDDTRIPTSPGPVTRQLWGAFKHAALHQHE